MYIDAIHDSRKGLIRVAEKQSNGGLAFVDYPAEYTFYYSHPAGSDKSIFGDSCRKFVTNDGNKFRKELGKYVNQVDKFGKPKFKIFESDLNPIFRCLEKYYMNAEVPILNIAFFDIETGFCKTRGYAPVEDPFNPVTAVSVYLTDMEKMITLALKPPKMDVTEARNICDQFDDTFLFEDEKDLLEAFLGIIGDANVLSGWNSTYYDIPYLVNRITKLMGEKATTSFCYWGQKPRMRKVMKFGKEHQTYDLVGRVHLDYLELYQKHSPQQQHSYRLDFIGEIEVKENKVQYDGTLDDLYNKDFYEFIKYSRQDVFLLKKIDDKLKYIELANQVAHVNCVQLKTTMGSVALVEQAIINEMHAKGLVVPSRSKTYEEQQEEDAEDKPPVVGAYVANPKIGIHTEVGSVDINSLYPSVIRALNISPETIVGQVRQHETEKLIEDRIASGIKRSEAWDGIFWSVEFDHIINKSDAPIIIDYEDGTERKMTGKEAYKYIFEPKNNLCITANGTIFKTDTTGIIPDLLAKWYSERKMMQKEYRLMAAISGDGLEIDSDIVKQISERI